MNVTVRFHNAYSDGHESTRELVLQAPVGMTDEMLAQWVDEEVYPETGDGHGADDDLGSCYTAEVIAADEAQLVGLVWEWID